MRITRILAVVALVLPMTACADDSLGSDSGSGPINIGAVSTLSGPVTFSEAPQAARAVFDEVNAKGGINGRKIVYTTADDKGDLAAATLAARDIIQSKKAVALAGGASLVDCQVNGPFYQRSNITDVRGIGVDAGCFTSASISPVNTGPFFGSTVTLYYASEKLKYTKICAFFTIAAAGMATGFRDGVDRWSTITGKRLVVNDMSLTTSTTDYTPYVLRARGAGCQAVLFSGLEPMSIGWFKAAQAQNITNIRWLFLAPIYTAEAAKALGSAGRNVVALSEFEPYSDTRSAANRDWRDTMTRHGVPLSAFAQGGYLAAQHLVTVLRSIKGDITRESVTRAVKNLKPLDSTMTGMPFTFGTGNSHASNLSAKFVKPDGKGDWTVLTPEWVKLPNT
ncbi:ABC transporter substrate-binding protein [Actinomadura macra]|uniref:ABC transporter substrate-binding protein n=1 Tax=Actinomadura macra TaxID=46164 RepID=UPI000836B9F6|nr:ABC transporter substrate-binding protein [Actinomadura macra]